ncbi:MAG: hypothetical protein WBY94_27745, partial [Polyangiaceae bacterium]
RAIASGTISDPRRRMIRIKRIVLDRALHSRTKMDRNAELLSDLLAYGQAKSKWFLRERRDSRPEASMGIGA